MSSLLADDRRWHSNGYNLSLAYLEAEKNTEHDLIL